MNQCMVSGDTCPISMLIIAHFIREPSEEVFVNLEGLEVSTYADCEDIRRGESIQVNTALA